MATKPDNFLADLHKTKVKNLSYQDGVRFGLGFAVANLMIVVVVGAVAWALVYFLHLR